MGVKWKWKRRRLFWFEPVLDGGAFVGAVVVEDEMDVEIRGHLLFQLVEVNELFAAVARQATADDLAIRILKAANRVVVPCRF